MAHDPRVLHQSLDIAFVEAGNLVEIEAGERRAKIVALHQDGAPAETRLKALEAELFEQSPVIGNREAPFAIVIGDIIRRRRAPAATREAVGGREEGCHVEGKTSQIIHYMFCYQIPRAGSSERAAAFDERPPITGSANEKGAAFAAPFLIRYRKL